jgi:hypothetical protein
MSLKMLCLLVPVLSLSALTGCKPSCTGLCDDAKDADCATTDTMTVNGVSGLPKSSFDHAFCYAQCQREDDMEADDVTSCTTEFDALMTCINSQSDICKVFDYDGTDTYDDGSPKFKSCSSEQHDYATCLSDYCKDHDKRDYCNAPWES